MALTNKAIPIVPVSVIGGAPNQSVTHTISYPAASATYTRGTLIVLEAASGWGIAATAAVATATNGMPVGFVPFDQTVAANADPLIIYPAYPNIVFRGSIVATTSGDGTFAQEDVGELRDLIAVLATESVTGTAVVAVGTASTGLHTAVVRLVPPNHAIQPAGATTAIGATSPWVQFVFSQSIWTTGGAAVDYI